jgi:hypothetical protein
MLTCYHYADPTCQLSQYSDGLDGSDSIPSSVSSFCHRSIQADPMSYPASYPTSTVDLIPGLRRKGLEADQLPPSSSEDKKRGAIPTLPFMFSRHSA